MWHGDGVRDGKRDNSNGFTDKLFAAQLESIVEVLSGMTQVVSVNSSAEASVKLLWDDL